MKKYLTNIYGLHKIAQLSSAQLSSAQLSSAQGYCCTKTGIVGSVLDILEMI